MKVRIISEREKKRQKRQQEERTLIKNIRDVFEKTNRIYGCRRLRKALSEEGIAFSELKIQRIMRENGLYPETMKKFKFGMREKSDGWYFTKVIRQYFSRSDPNQK